MLPACFHLADNVFPRVRAQAARDLVAGGWTQDRTAKALGVSQAMVSKYAAAPRDDDEVVMRLAEDLMQGVQGGDLAAGSWCATLAPDSGRSGAEDALRDFLSAEQRLLADAPVRLVPQVGLNLARALPAAERPEDVLAYPVRLVASEGRMVRPMPPTYGASEHLASCLLGLRARHPDQLALANVRGGPDVLKAARMIGPIEEIKGDGDRVAMLKVAATRHGTPPVAVHDAGAFGIEPCLYVAGATACEAADRIVQIHGRLP